MEEKKKRSFWESFKIWFGLGALMFGTYCGANMASGVYATTYMVTFGSGILIGVMVASLFFVTSLIVLPFLPDAFVATPILSICKEYMPGVMTAIYWLVVMLSVISTGPTFIFNTSNRFVKVWKTEKVPQRVKLFVIALAFLLLCLALSKIGLIAICQKGYTALGNVAIFAIAAPLFVSIIRVRKKDKADAEAAAAQKSEQ